MVLDQREGGGHSAVLTVLWVPAEAAELVGHMEEDHSSEKGRAWGRAEQKGSSLLIVDSELLF